MNIDWNHLIVNAGYGVIVSLSVVGFSTCVWQCADVAYKPSRDVAKMEHRVKDAERRLEALELDKIRP